MPVLLKIVIVLIVLQVMMVRREGHRNRISNPAKEAIAGMNKKIYNEITTKYVTKEDLGKMNEKVYKNVMSNSSRIEELEGRL